MDDQRICHEVLNFIQIDPGHTVKEISMEVYEMAKTVLGTSSNYLIGINSIDRSGNQWQYASDGSPKRFTDYGYGSGLDGGNECAALYSSNGFAEAVNGQCNPEVGCSGCLTKCRSVSELK